MTKTVSAVTFTSTSTALKRALSLVPMIEQDGDKPGDHCRGKVEYTAAHELGPPRAHAGR